MADVNARFIAFAIQSKQKDKYFFVISIVCRHLQHTCTVIPESHDLVVLLVTDRRQTDKTDHFIPCACTQGNYYSETSNNGLSERRTTSVQQTNSMPPIALPIEIP